MAFGVECSRSPDGKHDVIKHDVADHCRHCFVVPRSVMDDDVEAERRGHRYAYRKPGGGPVTPSKRQQVIDRDGLVCFYCEHELVEGLEGDQWSLTLDHLLPKALGGSNAVDNLVPACPRCNREKGADVKVFVTVIKRLRRQLAEERDRVDASQAYITSLQWEMFDAGLGEMPGRADLVKGKRTKKASFKRRRPGLSDNEVCIIELGERTTANLRAENVGPPHGRTASVTKRGRLLVRREKVLADA